jgi:ferredoxin
MAEWKIPQLNKEKCVVCGICVDVCPQGVLEMQAQRVIFARPQDCTYCGTCEESCPHDAVACSYEIGWA